MFYRGRFSSNSEVNASELLENREVSLLLIVDGVVWIQILLTQKGLNRSLLDSDIMITWYSEGEPLKDLESTASVFL